MSRNAVVVTNYNAAKGGISMSVTYNKVVRTRFVSVAKEFFFIISNDDVSCSVCRTICYPLSTYNLEVGSRDQYRFLKNGYVLLKLCDVCLLEATVAWSCPTTSASPTPSI